LWIPSLRGCTPGKLMGHSGHLLGHLESGWLGWAGGQAGIWPIRLGSIENLLSFFKSFIDFTSIWTQTNFEFQWLLLAQ
jgi:hypothetical protein